MLRGAVAKANKTYKISPKYTSLQGKKRSILNEEIFAGRKCCNIAAYLSQTEDSAKLGQKSTAIQIFTKDYKVIQRLQEFIVIGNIATV